MRGAPFPRERLDRVLADLRYGAVRSGVRARDGLGSRPHDDPLVATIDRGGSPGIP